MRVGDVVEIRGRLYRVARMVDGEPALVRTVEPVGWAIPLLARALSRPLDLDVMRGTRAEP